MPWPAYIRGNQYTERGPGRMCNCTCADEEFGPQEGHEVAALVFIVLLILACGIFLAWPALTATCCPAPKKSEEEVDLALSLLQMGEAPAKPRVATTYDGTHIDVHEMQPSSGDEDEVVGKN